MYFNSIKVRLEHALRGIRNGVRLFQFHKGTIRTNHFSLLIISILYFNSIKVRLERHDFSMRGMSSFDFNSIKVRLEHEYFIWILTTYIDFNSIKVRLEQCRPHLPKLISLFQFHKGTIRTKNLEDLKVHQRNFNSIKVRLEPRNRLHADTIKLISIP